MKSVKVGAVWKRKYKDGEYLKVVLNNGMTFPCFPNDNKTKDTHPDYRAVMEEEIAQKLDLLDDYDKARIADEAKGMVQQELGATEETKREDKPDEEIPF